MYHIKLFICLLLISPTLFSQTQKGKSLIETQDAVLQANLQKHVGGLAADKPVGDSGNDSLDEVKSALYLAAQYKKMGLQPLGESKDFAQSFHISEGLEVKKGTTLSVNGIPLKNGVDYWPFPFCQNTSFSGTATWAKAEANEPILYDIKNVLAANKANSQFVLAQFIYDKAKELAAGKATALLVYNSSETNDNLIFLPKDTSAVLSIPVVYITKVGVNKIMNESTIANALEGHFFVGEKKLSGRNVMAYIDNGAANTVLIGSFCNEAENKIINNMDNVSGNAAVLELARLLKELCATNINSKKNNAISMPLNYKNNNYCFVNFSGKKEGLYGIDNFVEQDSIRLSKINYVISINDIDEIKDSANPITVSGVNSASIWPDMLPKNDTTIGLKTIGNLDTNNHFMSFYNKKIPTLYFNTEIQINNMTNKINATNEARAINFIVQLIGRTNDKGKLVFTGN